MTRRHWMDKQLTKDEEMYIEFYGIPPELGMDLFEIFQYDSQTENRLQIMKDQRALNQWVDEWEHIPDEEGFLWLRNQKKGTQLPFLQARKEGFITPEFDIRLPLLPDVPLEVRIPFMAENEGVWIRESYAIQTKKDVLW